jgi:hypothetical protein
MHSTSQVRSPLLAIPGVLASIFSLAIGLVALLTSLASFGRQAEYGYLISPGAAEFCSFISLLQEWWEWPSIWSR